MERKELDEKAREHWNEMDYEDRVYAARHVFNALQTSLSEEGSYQDLCVKPDGLALRM
jgi:hypothetical protein